MFKIKDEILNLNVNYRIDKQLNINNFNIKNI